MTTSHCRRVALALLAGTVLACSPAPHSGGRPLVDRALPLTVRTESREIALPPAESGSRLVAGWRPLREVAAVETGPDGGRIELVHLEARPRELVLELAAPVAGVTLDGAPATVTAEGTALRIALPELPLGTPALRLGPPGIAVRRGALRQAASAGEARVDPAGAVPAIEQRGTSEVEVVVEAPAGSRLVGRLLRKRDGTSAPRVEVETLDGTGTTVGRWIRGGGLVDRLRGSGFELPLARGWTAVRLRVTGEGSPVRWEDLRMLAPATSGSGEPDAAAPNPAPPAVSPEPPRLVVLYVMDALRADHVGAFGGPAGLTPTWDRLAAGGDVFLAHRAVAPNTLPSTKALLTGRIWRERGGWKLVPGDGPSLAERFRDAGWRTALVSGNLHVGREYGTDRGFEHVPEAALFDRYHERERPPFHDNAPRVHALALDWLRTLRPDERAFLYVHVLHPHNPYDPPEPYRSRWAPPGSSTIDGATETLLAVRSRRRLVEDPDRDRLRGLYAASVAYADAELGRFLEALETVVPPAETALVLTSDHGEELFDHGGVLHGYTLHEEMIRIPLVVAAPGSVAPRRVTVPTTTIDLHATLLEIGGIPPGDLADGALSLRAAALPERRVFTAASSLPGSMVAAVGAGWKVVLAPRAGGQWGMGEGIGRSRDPEVWFDLAADPGERTNQVAATSALAPRRLRGELLAWRAQPSPGDPATAAEPVLDDEARARLRALGYVQ